MINICVVNKNIGNVKDCISFIDYLLRMTFNGYDGMILHTVTYSGIPVISVNNEISLYFIDDNDVRSCVINKLNIFNYCVKYYGNMCTNNEKYIGYVCNELKMRGVPTLNLSDFIDFVKDNCKKNLMIKSKLVSRPLNAFYGLTATGPKNTNKAEMRLILNSFYGLPAINNTNKFKIDRVIFSGPATIVYWADGTKTVVKCGKDDVFDKEKGLTMCFAKKALGNKGSYYDTIKKYTEEYK